MKILHVVPSMSPRTGGPSLNTFALSQALIELGHQSTIACTDADTPAQARDNGQRIGLADLDVSPDQIMEIFPVSHFRRWGYSRAMSHGLTNLVRDADVVHVHSMNLYPQFLAWSEAKSSRTPFVLSPHGALSSWIAGRGRLRKAVNNRLWQNHMVRDASAVHFSSHQELQRATSFTTKGEVVVIPNGLNLELLRTDGGSGCFRTQWLAEASGPIIMNHGRLSKVKGLDILIQAFSQLDRSLNAHLVFVGSDDEGIGDQLTTQARSLNVEQYLTFVPHLERSDLVDALKAADVWALPSHSDSFGLAVVEAMAAGKAVVASTHVSIAPDASSEEALMMVPNEADAFASEIGRLLDDVGLRTKIGDRASSYVQRFDWSVVAPSYAHLYERVASISLMRDCHGSRSSHPEVDC